jgi:hypothetical protein
MVTTSSHTQLRDRYRCVALIDDVVAALPRRFAPLGTLAALTDVAGMEPAGRFVPVDVVRERRRLSRHLRAAARRLASR